MNDPSNARPSPETSKERLHESKDRAAEAAQNAAQTVQNVAKDRVQEARSVAEDRIEQVRDTAQAKLAEARNVAENKLSEARNVAESKIDEAHTAANEQVSTAGHGLKDTASRLRDAASELEGKDRWLGAALEKAAGVADRSGDYLSGQKLGNIVDDAQHLARRNPAAFMGGAAAIGFALARLGKVTVDRATADSHDDHGYTASRVHGGVHPGTTHAPTDANRTTATHAPTPAGMGTGTVSPVGAAARPATRPTDGRDVNPAQSTPLHGSQT